MAGRGMAENFLKNPTYHKSYASWTSHFFVNFLLINLITFFLNEVLSQFFEQGRQLETSKSSQYSFSVVQELSFYDIFCFFVVLGEKRIGQIE